MRLPLSAVVASILACTAAAGCALTADEEAGSTEAHVETGSDSQYTGIWTNWWRSEFDLERKKAAGLLKILAIRTTLTQKNLFDTNSESQKSLDCTGDATTARTLDGTCNDLARPRAGAAGTRFGRNVPLASAVAEDDKTLMSPNPREISKKLLSRDLAGGQPKVKEVDFLNLTAASWIQFQVHDWFNHSDQSTAMHKVSYGGDTFFIPKSLDDSKPQIPGFPKLHVHENTNTHWWDGSQLYGSDLDTARRLRSKDGVHFATADDLVPGGRLRLDGNRLPLVGGKEDSGFTRNWWLGLSMLHTLFAEEHNAIATEIKAAHPDYSDDHVFDVARMVNAAVMAKIHTVEWTPAILSNPQLRAGMMLNWNGLSIPGVGERPPILGHAADPALTVVPYSLTEEFVSVYRMHSLLPEDVTLSHLDGSDLVTKPIANTLKGTHDAADYSMTDLFYSFGQQHPGQLTLHNFPKFLQDLNVERTVPGVGNVSLVKLDMGTVDILRDRERGVPRYNAFRRALNLLPIKHFEDLFITPPDGTPAGESVSGTLTTDQQRQVDELRAIYGKTDDGKELNDADAVERLDLLVGCLAESVRAPGFGFGETAFQIFILMASRRLQADRFYTTDYRPEIYTAEGIAWVEKASMKNVLLRHYPSLAGSLGGVENAFSPWKKEQ